MFAPIKVTAQMQQRVCAVSIYPVIQRMPMTVNKLHATRIAGKDFRDDTEVGHGRYHTSPSEHTKETAASIKMNDWKAGFPVFTQT